MVCLCLKNPTPDDIITKKEISRMSIEDYRNDKPVLDTERLQLRPMMKSDVEDLREWLGSSQVYTYWGRTANTKEQQPELIFQDPRPHVQRKPSLDFHLGIVDKDTQKLIGDIWIFDVENQRMAKVGYRLSPKFWGRGIATEALSNIARLCFERTELQRLWAEVHVENLASVKVLEKCGFIREGCIRQGKMISTYCDYYIYGLLRQDYENISGKQ